MKWSFLCFFVYFQGVEGKYLLVKPLKDKFSARSFTIDKTLGKSLLSYEIKHLDEIQRHAVVAFVCIVECRI